MAARALVGLSCSGTGAPVSARCLGSEGNRTRPQGSWGSPRGIAVPALLARRKGLARRRDGSRSPSHWASDRPPPLPPVPLIGRWPTLGRPSCLSRGRCGGGIVIDFDVGRLRLQKGKQAFQRRGAGGWCLFPSPSRPLACFFSPPPPPPPHTWDTDTLVDGRGGARTWPGSRLAGGPCQRGWGRGCTRPSANAEAGWAGRGPPRAVFQLPHDLPRPSAAAPSQHPSLSVGSGCAEQPLVWPPCRLGHPLAAGAPLGRRWKGGGGGDGPTTPQHQRQRVPRRPAPFRTLAVCPTRPARRTPRPDSPPQPQPAPARRNRPVCA